MALPNDIFCLAHFCEIHGPTTIICCQKQDSPVEFSDSMLSACDSCALQLPESATNLVTSTNESKLRYVSTRYPLSQRIYTSLKKMVMKCLSVEAVADPLKLLFFGDGSNGFCLSKVFSIKDTNARGGERKYALLMVSDSETHIIRNWDTISTYFNEIIALIQRQVETRLEEMTRSNSVDNERYLRRSKNIAKSLVQLTNDSQIFVKFHLWGIELLGDIQ